MATSELGRAQIRAVRWLTVRSRSEAELTRRLQQAGFASDVVAETIAWCRRLGYVDDGRFAADWIEYRLLHSPRGRIGLRHELREKGLAPSIIDDALETWLPQEEERRVCLQVASARAQRMAHLDPKVRQRRLAAFLQRRGFSPEHIRSALSEVDTVSQTE